MWHSRSVSASHYTGGLDFRTPNHFPHLLFAHVSAILPLGALLILVPIFPRAAPALPQAIRWPRHVRETGSSPIMRTFDTAPSTPATLQGSWRQALRLIPALTCRGEGRSHTHFMAGAVWVCEPSFMPPDSTRWAVVMVRWHVRDASHLILVCQEQVASPHGQEYRGYGGGGRMRTTVVKGAIDIGKARG